MRRLLGLVSIAGLAAAHPTGEGLLEKAVPGSSNSTNTTGAPAPSASAWWFPNIDLSNGDNYAPNAGSNNDYPVYIAIESGDADGLVKAVSSHGRSNDYVVAAQPRVIYVAPGNYELDSTLHLYTDTVIVGNAIDPPAISASSSFSGSELIIGGVKDDEVQGGESKFSTMMKNIILDTAANSGSNDFTALSWRVAQNSALVNVQVHLPQSAHTGISLGQGSTVQVGDTTVKGGNIGVSYQGMQQATLKNLTFVDCTTGIDISSGNTVNVFAVSFTNIGKPILLRNNAGTWVSVIDASVSNSGVFFTSHNQYPNFMIENLSVDSTKNDVVVVHDKTIIAGSTSLGSYVYGNTYGVNPIYQTGNKPRPLSRPSAIAPGGRYPVVTANQYSDKTVDDVVNLKDSSQNGGFTLKGDGQTDDGAALQGALNTAASHSKIAFLPFGVYRTSVTIVIPSGTELVGNGWSTISGYGSNFTDSNSPTPVVQIGKPGDTGTAHLQDLRFTVDQMSPGAIIVQVNIAGQSPGDVSIHNSLITVGGTPDTEIDCNDEPNCQAAYIGLHLAPTSSAYIDNVWAWVADHATDGSTAGTRISAKGGVLIEATSGTWLSGLASEHWWLYNVAYHNAANIFLSLLQTETNYHQGDEAKVVTPRPWTPSDSDPDFSWCDGSDNNCAMTIAQFYNNVTSLYSYAAGSWNFADFHNGNRPGVQTNMNVMSQEPTRSNLYGLCAHDTTNVMRLPDGKTFGDTKDYGGSWGDLVAEYDGQASN